ncbi:SigE family RNA polymerase sigma factor [Actinotalea solisilvae]|uniref:SigE family RNA polymerase sigma factor n=1 Tax=Actinotalea solisilvae TaxID=2072922 RepID=UPI0018F231B4|nr:SigE family RNA polymerase sigma factor [Actinotalea solisilvae]
MAGQDDVVGTLISTRGRALTGYAYLLCGNVEDAEDLVQDALVKTFARRRAGLRIESAEGYVRRAILTLYLDGWRRRGRWAGRRHLVVEPPSAAGPEDRTAAHVDVVAALRRLPPQQRACVVLRFYEDLTVAEIAEQLGVSDGSVKRYLSMGVHRMQALLGPVANADADLEIVQEA